MLAGPDKKFVFMMSEPAMQSRNAGKNPRLGKCDLKLVSVKPEAAHLLLNLLFCYSLT